MGQVKEWLSFDEQSSKGKTKIWEVIAMVSCTCLGEIRWCCGWRKYAFYPYSNTLYEQDCLRKIAGFVELATTNQRATWKRSPKETKL